MEVLSNSTIILLTAIITPVIYVAYNLLTFMLEVRRRAKAVNQFPGEPKHWFWGHIHLYPGPNEAGLAWIRKLTEKYPLASASWRGPVEPILVVRHPNTIKPLLTSSEPKPLRIGVYRYGKPWIGEGLLVSRGKKWARNRRLLTPAFHFDILKPYTVVNNEAAERLVKKIAKYAERGESFEFYSNVSLCTFDVILPCAMSYEDDIQGRGDNHPYVQSVTEMAELWTKRVLTPWLASDLVYYLTSQGRTFKKHCDFVHSISENLITKRQDTLSVHFSSHQACQHFAMFEQKVVLSRVLRRFHIELDPSFKVEKKISVVMRTQKEMKLKVTPRQIRYDS